MAFIILIRYYKGSYWGEHGWSAGDSEDGAARKAYQALLRVSLLKPTSSQFHNFSKLVKQKALENYNYTLSESEEVSISNEIIIITITINMIVGRMMR
jgi:atrial natriuretic peptide receptor A